MRTIKINGKTVMVTAETYRRIKKIAAERRIAFSAAVSFCLEKVI